MRRTFLQARLHPIPAILTMGAMVAMGVACDHKARQTQALPAKTAGLPPPPLDPNHIPDLSMWRSLGDFRPSFAGPHRGSFQRVYVNPVAASALDRGACNPWPEGSQLVKEALDRNHKRMAYFWMSKEQGQWVWATAKVDGKVAARYIGESSGACAACHAARASQFDGTFSPALAGKDHVDISAAGGARAKQPSS